MMAAVFLEESSDSRGLRVLRDACLEFGKCRSLVKSVGLLGWPDHASAYI